MFRKLAVLAVAVCILTAVLAAPVQARIAHNTIGDTGTLLGRGHAVMGTVLIECTAGQQVRFTLTLTQGGTSGTGRGAGVCTGELAAYLVIVPAAGGNKFHAGPAQACATAVNTSRGQVVDALQWCRAAPVELTN